MLVTTSREMVHPGELPPGWGWMVLSSARLVTIVDAPKLDPVSITRPFLAALLRRADAALGAFAPLAAVSQ